MADFTELLESDGVREILTLIAIYSIFILLLSIALYPRQSYPEKDLVTTTVKFKALKEYRGGRKGHYHYSILFAETYNLNTIRLKADACEGGLRALVPGEQFVVSYQPKQRTDYGRTIWEGVVYEASVNNITLCKYDGTFEAFEEGRKHSYYKVYFLLLFCLTLIGCLFLFFRLFGNKD